MTTEQIAAAKKLAKEVLELRWEFSLPREQGLAQVILDLAAEVERLRKPNYVCTVCRRDVAECECPAASELES